MEKLTSIKRKLKKVVGSFETEIIVQYCISCRVIKEEAPPREMELISKFVLSRTICNVSVLFSQLYFVLHVYNFSTQINIRISLENDFLYDRKQIKAQLNVPWY